MSTAPQSDTPDEHAGAVGAEDGYAPDAVAPEAPATVIAPASGPAGRPWWGEPWSAADGAGYGAASAPLPAGAVDAGSGSGGGGGALRLSAIVGVAVVSLLSAGIGAAVGVHVGQRQTHADVVAPSSTTQTTAAVVGGAGSTTIEAVAAAVQPAVVSIVEKTDQLQGTGSGVVIDARNGYILTNSHVVSAVAGGGGTLTVTTNDGRTASAHVIGRDPSADIAVVKVALGGLTQARLGDSASLKVGETVVAFGSPLGLQGSVTSGIVSALNRPVSTQDTNDTSAASGTGVQATIDAIQTDAAINPGNSGGPLVDTTGAVIGINSAIASLSQAQSPFGSQTQESGNIGVGFAIPIDEAVYTADQIIRTGHAVHAIIGVALAPDNGNESGATISSVTPGGPAAKAGLRSGDVVVAIDGRTVLDADTAIVDIRGEHRPGDTVTVTYLRGGTQRTTRVTLAASTPS